MHHARAAAAPENKYAAPKKPLQQLHNKIPIAAAPQTT
jgi:hypothetical protein